MSLRAGLWRTPVVSRAVAYKYSCLRRPIHRFLTTAAPVEHAKPSPVDVEVDEGPVEQKGPSMKLARTPITADDIRFLQSQSSPWLVTNHGPVPVEIVKEFKLPTFELAFLFMTKMAFYSNQINHHPKIVNLNTTVSLTMSTLHVGKNGPFVSKADLSLAIYAERIAKARDFKSLITKELQTRKQTKEEREQWGQLIGKELLKNQQ